MSLCLQKIPYSAFTDHFFNGIQMGEIKTRCMVDAGKQSLVGIGSRCRQWPVGYMALSVRFSIRRIIRSKQAT
jgi:hypothetical protein